MQVRASDEHRIAGGARGTGNEVCLDSGSTVTIFCDMALFNLA